MVRVEEALAHPVSTAWEAGWTFPFKGFWYFLTHPFLWPLLRARLLPCMILSTFVLVNLFVWTYLPQVAFLYIISGFAPGAWINGTFLVLSEGAAITAILFEAFFVDETLVDIFDSVLVERGREDMVRSLRLVLPAQDAAAQANGPSTSANGPPNPLHPPKPLTPLARLGPRDRRAVFSPFNMQQILELILFLPLNFIPFVGVPLYMLVTGYRAGPLQHWRYFKFMALGKKKRKKFIEEWRNKYTGFGTCALSLQLIPVFNMLFLMTSAAGAALFVDLLETKRRKNAVAPLPGTSTDPVVADVEEGYGSVSVPGQVEATAGPSTGKK